MEKFSNKFDNDNDDDDDDYATRSKET